MFPFVQWLGGKRQLLKTLVSYMPKSYNRYYEPFIGGGALFFEVAPRQAVINDINPQLINVYRQIRDSATEFIKTIFELESVPCTKDYYLEKRKLYNDKRNVFDVESAALLVWLNKHCFGGLYRVNSKGEFNAAFAKPNTEVIVEDNIRAISRYLQSDGVQIFNKDFEDVCADVQEGDFVFLDSPYVQLANSTDCYTADYYSKEDHERQASLFRKLDSEGAYLITTNHDVPLIRELYKGYSIETVPVLRTINCKPSNRRGVEVIITNYERKKDEARSATDSVLFLIDFCNRSGDCL